MEETPGIVLRATQAQHSLLPWRGRCLQPRSGADPKAAIRRSCSDFLGSTLGFLETTSAKLCSCSHCTSQAVVQVFIKYLVRHSRDLQGFGSTLEMKFFPLSPGQLFCKCC